MGFLETLSDILNSGRRAYMCDIQTARAELEIQIRSARRTDQALYTVLEELALQNQEMRVRIGVLVRLLTERGVISSEEFSSEIGETREQAAAAAAKAAIPPKPRVDSKRKTLPKPPRKLGPAQPLPQKPDPAPGNPPPV